MKIRYFASLREALGTDGEEIVAPDEVATVAALVAWLRARGEPWASVLAPERRWRAAVNQELADLARAVKPGDEIAFFPPVTGG